MSTDRDGRELFDRIFGDLAGLQADLNRVRPQAHPVFDEDDALTLSMQARCQRIAFLTGEIRGHIIPAALRVMGEDRQHARHAGRLAHFVEVLEAIRSEAAQWAQEVQS